MPIRHFAPDEAPNDVARALYLFTAPTRAVVLHYVVGHPGATASEAEAATGRASARPVLLELERLGFLTGDLPTMDRAGRTVRFTADQSEIDEAMRALHAWLSP